MDTAKHNVGSPKMCAFPHEDCALLWRGERRPTKRMDTPIHRRPFRFESVPEGVSATFGTSMPRIFSAKRPFPPLALAPVHGLVCSWLLAVACTPVPVTPDSDPPSVAKTTSGKHTKEATPTPRYVKGKRVPVASADYGWFPKARHAPSVGEQAPDFELPLVGGKIFSLADARAQGPVVVVFYRGFW